MDEGWVKIYRKMPRGRSGSRGAVYIGTMVWMIINANRVPGWTAHGDAVSRGELAVGYAQMARELGLSFQNVRTIVATLRLNGFLTSRATNKGTIITICNYESYQSMDANSQQAEQQATNKQLTSNQQTTNNPLRIRELEELKNLNTHSPEGERESAPETIGLAEAADGQKALPAPKPTCYRFEDFWNAYGKFTGRHKAELAYSHVGEADRAAIKSRLPSYVAATPELRFRKDPLTWIHGRCWEDETLPQRDAAQGDVLHGYNFAPGESGTGKQKWEA